MTRKTSNNFNYLLKGDPAKPGFEPEKMNGSNRQAKSVKEET